MKAARKRQHPEAALHRAVAKYLDDALPKSHAWNTFPAGGGGKIRGAQLRAMGLKPGWPDIVIFSPDGVTYWIELKSPKGRLSKEQTFTHRKLLSLGHVITIARSLIDVVRFLALFGLTRARP